MKRKEYKTPEIQIVHFINDSVITDSADTPASLTRTGVNVGRVPFTEIFK